MTNHRTTAFAGASLAALAFASFASPAAAQTYHGFAAPNHYVIQGGSPASPAHVADDPLHVFRSEAAYANFRAHMGSELGRPVSDEYFRAFMRSDRVRLVECDRSIDTGGITDAGDVGYRVRDCYTSSEHGKEMLIEIQLDDGTWKVIGSIWCWNPVRVQNQVQPVGPVVRQREYVPPAQPRRSFRAPTKATASESPPVLIAPPVIINSGSDDCCDC